MTTIGLGIQSHTMGKSIVRVMSQSIPCNIQRYFLVLDPVSWPFWQLHFAVKPDLLMTGSKIEPRLPNGNRQLSTRMFDAVTLETLANFVKMLHHTPKSLECARISAALQQNRMIVSLAYQRWPCGSHSSPFL